MTRTGSNLLARPALTHSQVVAKPGRGGVVPLPIQLPRIVATTPSRHEGHIPWDTAWPSILWTSGPVSSEYPPWLLTLPHHAH